VMQTTFKCGTSTQWAPITSNLQRFYRSVNLLEKKRRIFRRSLHDVHEMNNNCVSLSVRMFQLVNRSTVLMIFSMTLYHGGYTILVLFNFLQSIVTTWRINLWGGSDSSVT
jgi:hypothetical protein